MSGRNDAVHSRFMDLPVGPEVWDMLELMTRTKGKTSVGELLAEILANDGNKVEGMSFHSRYGMGFSESLSFYLENFREAKEKGTSQIGSRAFIEIRKEEVRDGSEGVDFSAEYQIVDEAGQEHDSVSFNIVGLYGPLASREDRLTIIPRLYKALLRLSYAGVKATDEDEAELNAVVALISGGNHEAVR